jgi:hypothetical protein
VANLEPELLRYELNPNGISRKKRRTQLLGRLRVQVRYFGARDPHSYLGVAATLALLSTPQDLVTRMKKLIGVLPF